MTVDTLSLATELRAAELSSAQAEAIAAAIGRAVLEGAAIKTVVQRLRSDLKQAKAALRGEIERLRSTLGMWFVGTISTLGAIIIAVVKL